MSMLWHLGTLTGSTLLARDGEIGTVKEVYFDDVAWSVLFFVVRIGGPMTGANVVVPARTIREFDPVRKGMAVDLDRREIGNSLAAGCVLPVSKHYDAELRWRAEVVQAPIVPPSASAEDTHALPDPPFPHLRSSAAILGYRVLATDHATGHVDDLILDENAWQIRYLVISKRLWWPGKKLMVPLTQVDRLECGRKSVSLRLSRKIIEGAPEY